MLTPYERQMIADALDPACAWLAVLFPEIPEFNMNQDGGRRDELIELVLTKCRDRLVIWLRRLRNLGGYAELIAIRYGGTDIVSEETFAQAQLPIKISWTQSQMTSLTLRRISPDWNMFGKLTD